ncbi:MAG: hypothetical protein ACO1N7_10050 [Sphingobacteriaceae bacterium]
MKGNFFSSLFLYGKFWSDRNSLNLSNVVKTMVQVYIVVIVLLILNVVVLGVLLALDNKENHE